MKVITIEHQNWWTPGRKVAHLILGSNLVEPNGFEEKFFEQHSGSDGSFQESSVFVSSEQGVDLHVFDGELFAVTCHTEFWVDEKNIVGQTYSDAMDIIRGCFQHAALIMSEAVEFSDGSTMRDYECDALGLVLTVDGEGRVYRVTARQIE